MGLNDMMMDWIPLKILMIRCLMDMVVVPIVVLVVLAMLVVEACHVTLQVS